MKWNIFVALFFLATAGLWHFGYYYYLDYPIFDGTDNGISEEINKINEFEKLKSVAHILARSKTVTEKTANSIIDTTMTMTVSVSLAAFFFFLVSIINDIKSGRMKKRPNHTLQGKRKDGAPLS
jgi:hypothetical protein